MRRRARLWSAFEAPVARNLAKCTFRYLIRIVPRVVPPSSKWYVAAPFIAVILRWDLYSYLQIENEADDPRNFQVDPRHMHDDDGPFGVHGAHSPFGPGTGPDRTLDIFQNLMMGLGGPQRRASTIRIDRRTGPHSTEQNTTISFGGGNGGAMRGTSPPGGFFISTASPGGNVDMAPMLNALFDGPPHSPQTGQRQEQGEEPSQPPNLVRQILLSIFGAPVGDHDGQFGDYAVTNEGEY